MTNEEMDQIKQFMEELEQRFETKLLETERRIMASMNSRFDSVESELKRLADSQWSHLNAQLSFMKWADRTDQQMRSILKRLDELEAKLRGAA